MWGKVQVTLRPNKYVTDETVLYNSLSSFVTCTLSVVHLEWSLSSEYVIITIIPERVNCKAIFLSFNCWFNIKNSWKTIVVLYSICVTDTHLEPNTEQFTA